MKIGESYRPANGTEGLAFYECYCDHCVHDVQARQGDYDRGCAILSKSLVYSTKDPEYPKEWQYDGEGKPICTAFLENGADPAPVPANPAPVPV